MKQPEFEQTTEILKAVADLIQDQHDGEITLEAAYSHAEQIFDVMSEKLLAVKEI